MKRELGIAKCGLACCLCAENDHCNGCHSSDSADKDWCITRRCCMDRHFEHCYDCEMDCRKGVLSIIKPYAFTQFAKLYGESELLDCLERNERSCVVYHRESLSGDYDDFEDVDELISFIRIGAKRYLPDREIPMSALLEAFRNHTEQRETGQTAAAEPCLGKETPKGHLDQTAHTETAH